MTLSLWKVIAVFIDEYFFQQMVTLIADDPIYPTHA